MGAPPGSGRGGRGKPTTAAERSLAAGDYGTFRRLLGRSRCAGCDLSRERTSIVVDRGNPDAALLLVGEAPGATEDATGRAFCGRAGAVLDDLLASAGLSTERDALIVNVVKCRPPGNRPPRADEAAACRPFLDRQIALSPARIVGLLGATALRHFSPELGRRPLGEVAGRPFRLPERHPDREFRVLYHPAALLYNRTLLPVMRRLVRDLATGLARTGSR